MQTIKATIDQRLLGELPRFFQGITAMLRELYQNAHRAGASELNIELDDSWTLLTFTDNGVGCQDPQQMLSAGLTGWDETQVTEPAGMGFFSLLNPSLVSSVTVESQIWSMVLKPEHVLAGHPIKVSENGCCRKGMRIEIRFKLPIYTANQWDKPSEEKWLEDIKDTRGIYPMKVFINEEECPNTEWKPQYEVDTPVGLVGLRASSRYKQAYWEFRPISSKTFAEALKQAANKSNDPLAGLAVEHYSIYWIVNPDCGVRPQLPGRDELIASRELDKAAEIILDYALKALRVDYAKAVKSVPDYGVAERHYGDMLNCLSPDGPRIPVEMALAILRAYGWKTDSFLDPASYSYSSSEYDSNCDVANYSLYDKYAVPVAFGSVANTINLLRWRKGLNFSAYVPDSATDVPVVIKGLKHKQGALVAIAKTITVNKVNLPYLFLDDDAQAHYLGDDADAYVIIAGDYLKAVQVIKGHDSISGWVAMQVNDHDSLYDYDDWMQHDDGDGEDDLDLAEVEATLITEVMDCYGNLRVSRAAARYYDLEDAYANLGEAKHHVGYTAKHKKTGDKAIDAATMKLYKAIDRLQSRVATAQQTAGIKAKLVDKPKPVKKAKPRSKK